MLVLDDGRLNGLQEVLLSVGHDDRRRRAEVTDGHVMLTGKISPLSLAGEEEVHARAFIDNELMGGWVVNKSSVLVESKTSCRRRQWRLVGRRGFLGRNRKRVGATMPELILLQSEKGPESMDLYVPPLLKGAETRCLPV
jgi:hypothetical protein